MEKVIEYPGGDRFIIGHQSNDHIKFISKSGYQFHFDLQMIDKVIGSLQESLFSIYRDVPFESRLTSENYWQAIGRLLDLIGVAQRRSGHGIKLLVSQDVAKQTVRDYLDRARCE